MVNKFMKPWLFRSRIDVNEPILATFSPKDDITVKELADIVQGIAFHNGPMRISQPAWDNLPDHVKRHFWTVSAVKT